MDTGAELGVCEWARTAEVVGLDRRLFIWGSFGFDRLGKEQITQVRYRLKGQSNKLNDDTTIVVLHPAFAALALERAA